MEFFAQNWFLMVASLAVTLMCIWIVVDFSRQPKEEQIEKVREWLLVAVTFAEQKYGSSTGQLKLRYVYDLFIQRFPAIAKVISFDFFSDLVDEALKEMRKMLENNKAIKAIVEGEEA